MCLKAPDVNSCLYFPQQLEGVQRIIIFLLGVFYGFFQAGNIVQGKWELSDIFTSWVALNQWLYPFKKKKKKKKIGMLIASIKWDHV